MKQSTLLLSLSLSPFSLQGVPRMPRPGPRPYDCVRRAWHSERHQPIRGTLIQEIFRVVDEIHGSATKKNKEYQEKLPVVVLRAEEIMYSKANSEAEYMDLTTLLERTNDAIDTIIRRDGLTETGEYLQPCIEAALSLGCSSRKVSRSQRNSPRCYLSRSIEEVPNVCHDTVQNADGGPHTTKSQFVSRCMNFVKTTSFKSTHLSSERGMLVFPNDDDPTNQALPFVSLSENVPPSSKKQCSERQRSHPSNLFSVYPLYYGKNSQFDESLHGFDVSRESVSNTCGPAIMGVAENPLPCSLNASSEGSQSFKTKRDAENTRTATACDLSLRLGPLTIPTPTFEDGQVQENEVSSMFSGNKWSFKDESKRVQQPTVRRDFKRSASLFAATDTR